MNSQTLRSTCAVSTENARSHLLASQHGFSLLETLVALVILSLALGVLYQSTSGATRNAMVSSQYAVATALAESVLDDFTTGAVAGASANGAFDIYSWQALALPEPSGDEDIAAVQNAAAELSRVTVSVRWEGIGRQREVRLETVVGMPYAPST